PWYVMIFFTWFYIKNEKKEKNLFWLFVISCIILIISFLTQNALEHTTILRDNKYPPNIFYISYGTTVILGLALYGKFLQTKNIVTPIINFFSRFSYSIYFLHYAILTVLVVYIKQFNFNWITLFLSVIILTVILQKLYLWIRMKLSYE